MSESVCWRISSSSILLIGMFCAWVWSADQHYRLSDLDTLCFGLAIANHAWCMVWHINCDGKH